MNSTEGTELKLMLTFRPKGNYTLSECDFVVEVWSDRGGKVITIPKSEAIKETENSYQIIVDTSLTGAGKYYFKLNLNVPDADLPSGYRRESGKKLSNIIIDS